MMKAVQIIAPGPSKVLSIVNLITPVVKSTEVLVKLSYAGVNYIDTYHRSGVYKVAALPWVLGLEGSGFVVAVGGNVKDFKVGDKVAWPSCPHR